MAVIEPGSHVSKLIVDPAVEYPADDSAGTGQWHAVDLNIRTSTNLETHPLGNPAREGQLDSVIVGSLRQIREHQTTESIGNRHGIQRTQQVVVAAREGCAAAILEATVNEAQDSVRGAES